jgi:hypothetical protein
MREDFVDACRGLLIVLMVSTHSMTQLHLYARQLCWGTGCLPHGWASTSFVMLSGFTIARSMSGRAELASPFLLKRGRQLLVIMFLSNIGFVASKEAIAGNLERLANVRWWLGLVTFDTPYSVSAILIPTAIVVLVSPVAIDITARRGRWVLNGAITAGLVAALLIRHSDVIATNRLLDLALGNGVGGFPIAWYVLLGLIGFSIGDFSHSPGIVMEFALAKVLLPCTTAAYVVARWFDTSQSLSKVLFEVLAPVLQFLILLATALMLDRADLLGTARLSSALANIGRFGLMAFLAHRILLQALAMLVTPAILGWSPTSQYLFILGVVVVVLALLSHLRSEFPSVNQPLKAVGL